MEFSLISSWTMERLNFLQSMRFQFLTKLYFSTLKGYSIPSVCISVYHYTIRLCICTQLLMFCSCPALDGSLFTFLLAFLFSVSQKHLVGSLLAKIIPGTITAEPLRKRTQRQFDKGPGSKTQSWMILKGNCLKLIRIFRAEATAYKERFNLTLHDMEIGVLMW